MTADGKIVHWHAETGKKLFEIEDEDNPLMTVDYNAKGTHFATGGNDRKIRLYDEDMKTLVKEMEPKMEKPGHWNRVFAVKFHPNYDNILLSGGWDGSVQIYDVRSGKIENSILNNYIGAETLDIKDMNVLVGQNKFEEQLKIWDLRNLNQKLCFSSEKAGDRPTYCLGASFNKTKDLIVFGGYDDNIFRIYENAEEMDKIAAIDLESKCSALGFSEDGTHFAYGSDDGVIRIGSIN